jgi:hypothetical protein
VKDVREHQRFHPGADHSEFHEVLDPLRAQATLEKRHTRLHADPFTPQQHDAFHSASEALLQRLDDQLNTAHSEFHPTQQ